jgi:hypothetical protein
MLREARAQLKASPKFHRDTSHVVVNGLLLRAIYNGLEHMNWHVEKIRRFLSFRSSLQ